MGWLQWSSFEDNWVEDKLSGSSLHIIRKVLHDSVIGQQAVFGIKMRKTSPTTSSAASLSSLERPAMSTFPVLYAGFALAAASMF